jgi:hypothetical protein
VGYDCDIYWQDLTGSAFGANPGNTWYEIPDVQSLDVSFIEDRLNHKGLGQQTREWKDVTKQDDSITIEVAMEETANSTWALAQEITPDFTETTPCQIGLVVRIDTTKNGTMDTWVYALGNIFNTLTVKSTVNDATMLTMNFLTQRLSLVTSEIGTPVYNTIASPNIETFVGASLQKTEDGVTGHHNEINDVTTVDATDQGADQAITVESDAAGDNTQTVYTLYKNAAGTVALGTSALNGVNPIAVGTGDTVLGAYLSAGTTGNITITYDRGGAGDADLLVWDGSSYLSAGMITSTGGNVAYTNNSMTFSNTSVTFTCSNAAAVDSIMVYGTNPSGVVTTEYLTMVAGVATTSNDYASITHVGCSGTLQTETFVITSNDWTNLNSAATMDEVNEMTVVMSNNATKLWGFDSNFYCREIVLGENTVTGDYTKAFIGIEEINEITAVTDATSRFGRLIHTIATGETIQVENVYYDQLNINMSETAPLFQKIPWTGDSYSFP